MYDEQIKQLSVADLPGAHWTEKPLNRIFVNFYYCEVSNNSNINLNE